MAAHSVTFTRNMTAGISLSLDKNTTAKE
uniref:Uncharacterized protein n=1 Tax=Anguilla anguilla TaxID=7936 RepID=A0A0E9U5T2_ANGAN